MKEMVCDLWVEPAEYRCIPTSGALDGDGNAIMDAGVALEAKNRFHDIQVDLGRLIASRGNHVHLIRPGTVSFPVKQFEWSGVNVQIVQRSAQELCSLVGDAKTLLPHPAGKEDSSGWAELTAALATLPDNIIIVK